MIVGRGGLVPGAVGEGGDHSRTTRGVEFIDEVGREEGELGFTLNFGECEDLDDEVDARFPPT